ncbi:MAG: class IV adenylate cyclase [Melioribacteraceae bacterium]|nr:class IV adenylate cyclase [Melioribacteraceae bacterium]MCF8264112.1 class IV adenylate cyclase [Melioribacteraceae bacterium]MCF8431481.1 class IV adenylate cyclase [Melioribacteraceae bacterium]
MPINIEIKARVKSLVLLEEKVKKIADFGPELIKQEDVFFKTENCRLKLRIFDSGKGELIYYKRANTFQSKESNYEIYKTENPESLRDVLNKAYGSEITVRKKRVLYLIGQTRVHLDEVEELGAFMELEYVLKNNESRKQGENAVTQLMETLEISKSDLISVAYADLLAKI